ncbi:MAG: hypothetical protein ACJART_002460 [Maribacter sp.]|jgi:hypothetical protein
MAQSATKVSTRQKKEKVTIFPNPATSVINVLGVKDTEKAYIIISDIYGNTVLQHEWKIKNKAVNISIADLKKGIYLIAIQSREQRVHAKFYKQ